MVETEGFCQCSRQLWLSVTARGGEWFCDTCGKLVKFTTTCAPQPDPRDAELAELRAELAAIRVRAKAISKDFIPECESHCPLALREMREAIAELAEARAALAGGAS